MQGSKQNHVTSQLMNNAMTLEPRIYPRSGGKGLIQKIPKNKKERKENPLKLTSCWYSSEFGTCGHLTTLTDNNDKKKSVTMMMMMTMTMKTSTTIITI